MARARNIKPGFYKNEELAECSIWARHIFPGLWQLADREGRLEDRPKRIKGELLAYDTQNVEPLLQELHERGFILRYQVDGQRFIQVIKFTKHQNPHHREPPSVIPPPPSPGFTPDSNWSKPRADGGCDASEGTASPQPSPNLAVLNPESPFSESGSLNPESSDRPPASPSAIRKQKRYAAQSAPDTDTRATWQAFTDAFVARYGTSPKRNPKVNAQMLRFVRAVGVEDAPHIAAFYCRSDNGWYRQKVHSVGVLESEAEALATQWAMGRSITRAEARMADETAARGSQAERLMKIDIP